MIIMYDIIAFKCYRVKISRRIHRMNTCIACLSSYGSNCKRSILLWLKLGAFLTFKM